MFGNELIISSLDLQVIFMLWLKLICISDRETMYQCVKSVIFRVGICISHIVKTSGWLSLERGELIGMAKGHHTIKMQRRQARAMTSQIKVPSAMF